MMMGGIAVREEAVAAGTLAGQRLSRCYEHCGCPEAERCACGVECGDRQQRRQASERVDGGCQPRERLRFVLEEMVEGEKPERVTCLVADSGDFQAAVAHCFGERYGCENVPVPREVIATP